MDRSYSKHGLIFEWDADKERDNRSKHGVDFETACEVLFDPLVRVVEVNAEPGETREAVIGLTEGWRLLHVVFVERKDAYRIVSARLVTAEERKFYEEE